MNRGGIGSSLLACGYFGMHTEEVWIGSGSVGPFVWVSNMFWSILHIMLGCCWMKQPDVLQFRMNENDRDLPSCLQALRHVYRRGLDWFQQPWSFRLGYSSVLIHCVAWMRTAGRNADILQFLLNKMDRDLPSCLQVIRHVYRRGLDWFQQCRSFRLGSKMYFGPFGTFTHGWTEQQALL